MEEEESWLDHTGKHMQVARGKDGVACGRQGGARLWAFRARAAWTQVLKRSVRTQSRARERGRDSGRHGHKVL